jgi:hypothetical protein
MLDLQSKSYEDQRLELFGGVDPKTGKNITGKYDLLSREDQRAADQLYGFNDENGVHHMGTLELQKDSNEIQRQGLSLEEARIKGYQKPDGTFVKGDLEINAEKLGVDLGDYQMRRDALYGTEITNADGTKTRVPGSIEIAAKSIGLQEKSLDMQYRELFGYTDEKGNKVKGKYDLMNDEQKREADRLYGYMDPQTNNWVDGELVFEQKTAALSHGLAERKLDLESVLSVIDYLPAEAAGSFVRSIMEKNGIEGPPENQVVAGKQATSLIRAAIAGVKMEYENIKTISDAMMSGADVGMEYIVDTSIEDLPTVYWDKDNPGTEKDRWALTDEAKTWVDMNKGKLYRAKDGGVYQVIGLKTSVDKRDSTEGIIFRNLANGSTTVFTNAINTGGKNRRLPAFASPNTNAAPQTPRVRGY